MTRTLHVACTLLLAACGVLAVSCSDTAEPVAPVGGSDGAGGSTGDGGAVLDGEPRRPDVLLISLDTLRADALSCYGNPNPTTPVMDALAERGVRFANCHAPSPHTAPSHVSLFTGLLPVAHGIPNVSSSAGQVSNLSGDFSSIDERFAANGWRVVMVGGRGQLRPTMGIMDAADFRHFRSKSFLEGLEIFDEVVAVEDADAPLFAFFHTYEPHAPYLPPREFEGERFKGRFTDEGYDGRFALYYDALIDDPLAHERAGLLSELEKGLTDEDRAFLRGLYDENVAWTDFLLGKLLESWSKYRDMDNTLVVLVSDHGEQLGERDGSIGHRAGVWRELAHVPLIVAGPGIEPGVVDAPVGLVSVPATVLERVGLPALADAAPTLGPLLLDPDSRWSVPAHSQDAFGDERAYSGALAGLQTIVFERDGDNRVTHFDLARDSRGLTRVREPGESESALRKRVSGRLSMDRTLALEHPPSIVELVGMDDLRKRLEELGYTDGDGE